MDFVWDTEKNDWLKRERLVSFEEIAAMIQEDDYCDVIENPARAGQQCVIVRLRSYTWIVPYVIDAEDRIVLKTAYPSRKYHRIYGDNA
jgi:uncharacterized DUF497 family protein